MSEQLEYLQQMEGCYGQILDLEKSSKPNEAPKSDDLMGKYLVCKSLPRLVTRLLLRYHGSSLLNVNMQAESDYFALKDISK